MVDPEKSLDKAIELLMEVRDMPLAETPQGHIERSDNRYELLHIASQIIVLDVMDSVREEGDVFRRFRDAPNRGQ